MPPTIEGKVFRLGSGRWAYRLHRGRGGQVGGFTTKGAAREALDKARDRYLAGTHERPRLTVNELVDEYLAQYEAKANTRATLEARLAHVRAAFGDVPLERLDPRSIAAWRARLPRGSAWAIHKAASQVLNYAVRVRLVDSNPFRDVRNVEPKRDEVVPFGSWAEVEAVAARLPAHLRPLPVFMAGTGLRPEEVWPLRREDVDGPGRVVHVRRTFTKGILSDSPAKGKGARRRVPLRASVLDALDDWPMPLRPDGLVFPARDGGMIDLDNFRAKAWNPAVEASGIEPRRTPYALRHTYAAWALAAGLNLYTLARRMGTSVEQIDKTYGHLAADSEAVERDLLDAFDRRLNEQRREQA